MACDCTFRNSNGSLTKRNGSGLVAPRAALPQIKLSLSLSACSLPLGLSRFAGFQKPRRTHGHGIDLRPWAIGAADRVMRGKKINETLVFGVRREIDPVDEAGERRFRFRGPSKRRSEHPPAAARKAGDVEAWCRVVEPEAEAFPRGGAIAGQAETGNFEGAELGGYFHRLLRPDDRAAGLGGAPCEFHVKRCVRRGFGAGLVNEEVQQGRGLAQTAELPDVLAAAPGSMPPRTIEFGAAREFRRLKVENFARAEDFDPSGQRRGHGTGGRRQCSPGLRKSIEKTGRGKADHAGAPRETAGRFCPWQSRGTVA